MLLAPSSPLLLKLPRVSIVIIPAPGSGPACGLLVAPSLAPLLLALRHGAPAADLEAPAAMGARAKLSCAVVALAIALVSFTKPNVQKSGLQPSKMSATNPVTVAASAEPGKRVSR